MKRGLVLRAISIAIVAVATSVGSRAEAALLKLRVTTDFGSNEVVDLDDDGEIVYTDDDLGIEITVISGSSSPDGLNLTIPALQLSVASSTPDVDPDDLPMFLIVDLVQTYESDTFAPLDPGFVNFNIANTQNTSNTGVHVIGYVDPDGNDAYAFGDSYDTGITPPSPIDTTVFGVHGSLNDPFTISLRARVDFDAATDIASFIAEMTLDTEPVGSPLVPEPASLAVWGGLSVLGLVFGRRFSKKAA